MRLNIFRKPRLRTHERGPARVISDSEQLRRSVLACLLWEDEFYEDGVEIAKRVAHFAMLVPAEELAALAIEAREVQHLRHMPLLLVALLAQRAGGTLVAATVERIVQRADELAELLVVIAELNGVEPSQVKSKLSAAMKRGLARAFLKFDAYQLAKYDRAGPVRLRDVLFLVHPKPQDEAQAALWKQLAQQELEAPDTWEVALSGGADKRATFERLLAEKKLGYLALLRNLRNMAEAGVDDELVRAAILARRGADRVLPFRFVAAARACPRFDAELSQAMVASVEALPALPGRTIVLVDVSGSMDAALSRRGDLKRVDAAAALASIVPGKRRVFTFSNLVVEVAPRSGLAGIDAILASQPHGGTELGAAVVAMNSEPHDRLIVITDEQSADPVPAPVARHAYMINVASNRNGVGYGAWTHIDGFSENVLRFIAAHEAEEA